MAVIKKMTNLELAELDQYLNGETVFSAHSYREAALRLLTEVQRVRSKRPRVDVDALGWILAERITKKGLPVSAGVYVITLDERILYVGKAVNIRSRFASHQIDCNNINYREFKGDKSKVRVKYCLLPVKELIRYEKAVIRHFKPEMNYQWNPNKPKRPERIVFP